MSITDKTATRPDTGTGTDGADTNTEPAAPAPKRSFWTGRSELVVVALVLAVAIFLTVGTVTMDVAGDTVPGPKFFPTIICVMLYAVAGVLGFQILRNPARGKEAAADESGPDDTDALDPDADGATPDPKTPEPKTYTDWKTVGILVGSIVAFILLLPIAGWILSAAFLFWMVCFVLGSKRRLFDASLAILFSSAIQLAFNALLGLNLPSGFLEGVL
ncbi:tripartite tricarboxylate transporter TctB family protein [Arthrobacter castelli]|uniref:tripartite tricarboxylate transporter TctB family protein n=1 Tax=Arthrobacter castelli TaxID=271431 RepID=UPI00042A8541|nr:tripartite tricarboxylate transporter TctB family protein [Arthrobacter castelli]